MSTDECNLIVSKPKPREMFLNVSFGFTFFCQSASEERNSFGDFGRKNDPLRCLLYKIIRAHHGVRFVKHGDGGK